MYVKRTGSAEISTVGNVDYRRYREDVNIVLMGL